jgi:protein-disulfide isomerase
MEAYKQKGSKAFWEMHGKLFQNQQDLKRETLDKYAGELGLDAAKFKSALDNHTQKAAVDADAKLANDAGISGTPAFVVGPYLVSGAQPLSGETVKVLMVGAVEKAARATASGSWVPSLVLLSFRMA